MANRISFNSEKTRDLFFQECLQSSNFDNWNKLAHFLKIRRNMLSNYRAGKLTFPENFYIKLIEHFSNKNKIFFSENIHFLDSNWGKIKGGKITYQNHKNIFDAGRRKAINTVRKRSHKFNINLLLTKELAYFIGLFIGDGFTNKYGKYHLTQFTGSKEERQFYETLISDYCKNLFNLLPKIREDKMGNFIRINFYSIDLFELITKRFLLSPGRKSRTVLIPEEILKSESSIVKSCISGLYDAEGCIFFDKRKSYKKPYPRIDLHMCNLDLLKQIYSLLSQFGIKCSLVTLKDNLRVIIYGEEQAKKFIKKIGFSNPKHLEKLKTFI